MWTEDEMAAYEHRWPIGTRQRVWLDVLAYTGLRRGDAVRLGRQHVRNGVASLKVEKGGYAITVTLPILPVLAATLAAGPVGELAFIVGERGKPLTKESSAMNSVRPARRPAFLDPHMAFGRSRPPGLRLMAQRRRSFAPYSDGQATRCHRITQRMLTGSGSRARAHTPWFRTISEHLFPHLMIW